MQDFIEALSQGDILTIFILVWVIIRLILGVIEFIGTRNTAKLKKSLQEVSTMVSKFRLPNYQDTDSKAVNQNKQSFTPYTEKYVYNEDTKELSLAVNPETGEVLQTNDQEYINSFASSALDKVLERFLPSDYEQVVPPITDAQYGVAQNHELKDYADILDHAEELRQKYGLDADMTCIDVFNFVDNLNTRYKDKISAYEAAKSQFNPAQSPKEQASAQKSEPVQMSIDYEQLAQAVLNAQNKEVK